MSEVVSIADRLPPYSASEVLAAELERLGVQIWVRDWTAAGARHTLLFEFETFPISQEAQEKMASFRKRFDADEEFYEAVWVSALQIGGLVRSV